MPGNIGFGLIIIIIRNKILDRVFREELFEFRIELCGESLIMRHNQRGHLQLLDNGCNGKRLARAGRAEQHLIPHSFADTIHKLGNRFGLVTGGYKWGLKFKGHRIPIRYERAFYYIMKTKPRANSPSIHPPRK